MKTCCVCNQEKPLDAFGPCASARDGKQYKCILCNRLKAKEHYQLCKEKHHLRAKDRKKRIREALAAIKEKAGCQLCPEDDAVALDFHHLEGGDKALEVSMVSMGIDKLLNEAGKCEIICSNCHRKVHAGKKKLKPRRKLDLSALTACKHTK